MQTVRISSMRCMRSLAVASRARCSNRMMSKVTVHASSGAEHKAAMMIIGNEVLSGSIADLNTPWLAKLLYSRGVDLVRVEMIPDEPTAIAETLLRLRKHVGPSGAVFTSGGIGPTHDDITYASIAKALGLKHEVHAGTVAQMHKHYDPRGIPVNEERMLMATLPSPADEILVTEGLWVPLVRCGAVPGAGAMSGVYILPGIPRLFKQMVSAHQERFSGPAFYSQELFTEILEGNLASTLTKIAAEHTKVNIGSYPNVTPGDKSYQVKLQFSSRDSAAVDAAVAAVRSQLEVTDTVKAV